jgi:hypothetical protein
VDVKYEGLLLRVEDALKDVGGGGIVSLLNLGHVLPGVILRMAQRTHLFS